MAALVQPALQGCDQGIPFGLDLVLDVEDFLPLAPLLALQGSDLILDTGLFLDRAGGPGPAFGVLQTRLRVV